MFQGKSPYLRDTYRYTPLLAILLSPNVFLSDVWGKLIFSVCDIIVGYLIYRIQLKNKMNHDTALFCAQLWLYNPLSLTISSRGNAESFIAVLVLGTVHLISHENQFRTLLGGLLYGLSIHMKIYPVTFALSIYLYVGNKAVTSYISLARRSLRSSRRLLLLPCMSQLQLVIAAVFAFIATTGGFYYM